MATTYKVLGQQAPGATSWTTLYTVPEANSAVCSTLSVCNRGATASFRVAVRPEGEALANKHYIVYDNYVNAADSIFLTLGITLGANDVVAVYADSANVSYTLFGSEIS